MNFNSSVVRSEDDGFIADTEMEGPEHAVGVVPHRGREVTMPRPETKSCRTFKEFGDMV